MGKDPSQPDAHREAERCAWGKISPFPHELGLPARGTATAAVAASSAARFKSASMTATHSNIKTYDTPEVSQEDDYLFDLRGFLLVKQAVPAAAVAALNAAVDAVPPLAPREWHGHVHRNDYSESWGYNLQNIVEGGEPFEQLIDCPGFLPWVKVRTMSTLAGRTCQGGRIDAEQ